MLLKIKTQSFTDVEVTGCYCKDYNYYYFRENNFVNVCDLPGFQQIVLKEEHLAPSDIGVRITEAEFMEVYDRVQGEIESILSEIHHGLHFQVVTPILDFNTGEKDHESI